MVRLDWTDFKSCIARGIGLLVGTETAAEYIVYGMGRHETICCKLDKNPTDTTDRDEYVNNYKTLATTSMLAEYFNYLRITGNATTTVKSGGGILQAIVIADAGTGGTVKVYDNTAGSGTVILELEIGTPSGGLLSTTGYPNPVSVPALSVRFSTGLTVVTSGSSSNDITVIYR